LTNIALVAEASSTGHTASCPIRRKMPRSYLLFCPIFKILSPADSALNL